MGPWSGGRLCHLGEPIDEKTKTKIPPCNYDAAAAVAAAATSFPARFRLEVDLQLLCSVSNPMKSYLLASSSLSFSKLITCGKCVPVETTRPSYPDICAVEHPQVFRDLSRHGKARSAVAMRRRQRMTTSEMKSFGTTCCAALQIRDQQCRWQDSICWQLLRSRVNKRSTETGITRKTVERQRA